MLPRNLFRRPSNKLEGAGADSIARPEIPGQLYAACPACKAMNPAEELKKHADVCPKCSHHIRIGVRRRIKLTADPDSFVELWPKLAGENPLGFPDYENKLEKARTQSGEVEGVVTGECTIGECPAALFAMEPAFMMGSMGTVVGEKIARLFERALQKGLPVVGYCVSGGARMQEGRLSLMQMAKTTGAVKRHSDAGGLFIAVLTDPTTGGVTASFAMEGDITIAEPGALIGFAGPRVIEQTIRQKLAEGFQRAEFVLEKGFVDMIVDRRDLTDRLISLLKLHRKEEAHEGI